MLKNSGQESKEVMAFNAVGKGVAVSVARGDVPGTMLTGEILRKEGWLPRRH